LTRRILSIFGIGAALVLLSACAQQGQPAAVPTPTPPAVKTVVPTSTPLSSPPPSVEPAGWPPATAPAAASVGADLLPGGAASPRPLPLACRWQDGDPACDLGDLRPGDAVTVTLDLSSGGPAPNEAAEPVLSAAAADLVLQADGPTRVTAGQPFTYTYIISNQGASDATRVWFEDAVPSDMNLVAYSPEAPECQQEGDTFTCTLRDPDSGETVTFTLVITGYGGQPMQMGVDPLRPGWPICWVIKERTWLHIVQCQLGDLGPGQARRVQLVLVAIGEQERTSVNTASAHANGGGATFVVSTSTVTITIQAGAEPAQP
jgi:uncharacterized repeat protein (TIGR01451 family)